MSLGDPAAGDLGDGGSGAGAGFSIDIPGVNGVANDVTNQLTTCSGVTGDLSSQVLQGSVFAGIGSDVAAANSSLQDGLSNGLTQCTGLLGSLNSNVMGCASNYSQVDSAIADGFGGLTGPSGSGTVLSGDTLFGAPSSGTLLAGDAGGSSLLTAGPTGTGLPSDSSGVLSSPGGSGTDNFFGAPSSGTLLAGNADGSSLFQPTPTGGSALPLMPAAGTPPAAVNSWWNGLSTDQQQQLATSTPGVIGSLDGVPVAVRSYANVQNLGTAIDDTQTQINQTQAQITTLQNMPQQVDISGQPAGIVETIAQQQQVSDLQTKLTGLQNRLGGLEELSNQVTGPTGPDGAAMLRYQFPTPDVAAANPNGTYLIEVDTNGAANGTLGHWVASVNNPDYANNVATLIPGTNANLTQGQVSFYLDAAGNINGAANAASGPTVQNSTVVWSDYNAPQNVLPQAIYRDSAVAGAPALARFQDGLYDTNTNGWGLNTTVIPHSYANALVGEAALLPGGLNTNTVVGLASPGFDVSNAKDLLQGMRQQDAFTTQAPQVFVARNPSDIIWAADTFGFDVPGTTMGHGANPYTPGFGAPQFDAGPGPGTISVAGHMDYFAAGGPSVQNMGQIMTGNFQKVTPDPRVPLPGPAPTLPSDIAIPF